MKTLSDLEGWFDAIEWVSRTPAGRALDARLVTEADLLRLKVIARLHARGLPPHVGWGDLLQEAFTRVLDGSRRKPEGVPMAPFLAGVMRSIKEQYWRQARRHPAERMPSDFQEGELLDPTPSPERRVIAIQEVESIKKLFADDLRAMQVIGALHDGQTPEETCIAHGMSKTDYDSTRKRIRRALVRAGLRWFEP